MTDFEKWVKDNKKFLRRRFYDLKRPLWPSTDRTTTFDEFVKGLWLESTGESAS